MNVSVYILNLDLSIILQLNIELTVLPLALGVTFFHLQKEGQTKRYPTGWLCQS